MHTSLSDQFWKRAHPKATGKMIDPNRDIHELCRSIEDAMFWHARLAPEKPTTPDQLPMRKFHTWEDRQRFLHVMLDDLRERGRAAYEVEPNNPQPDAG